MDGDGKLWSKADFQSLSQLFIETTAAAMAIADVKRIIRWCNDRFTDVNEEHKKDIIGSHLGERIFYQKGTNVNNKIQKAVEQGYTEIIETKWMTKTGKKKFMNQRIYRLDDLHGNHIGFWVIAYELTKIKRSIDDSKAAIRVLCEMQKEEIKEKQLQVIEMIKVQSDILCPGKNFRGDFCPAILAVEESIVNDRPCLSVLLTDTELKVASYTKQGMSIKAISKEMYLSERTIKNHRYSIRKKLNITHVKISLTKYLQGLPI